MPAPCSKCEKNAKIANQLGECHDCLDDTRKVELPIVVLPPEDQEPIDAA